MPIEDTAPFSLPDRTVTAMSERMVAVETILRQHTSDLAVIRQTNHNFAGDMQKMVIAEDRCARFLEQIVAQTKDIPTLVNKIGDFEELKPEIVKLINKEHQRYGAWNLMLIIGTSLVGSVAVVGGVAGAIVWLVRFAGH